MLPDYVPPNQKAHGLMGPFSLIQFGKGVARLFADLVTKQREQCGHILRSHSGHQTGDSSGHLSDAIGDCAAIRQTRGWRAAHCSGETNRSDCYTQSTLGELSLRKLFGLRQLANDAADAIMVRMSSTMIAVLS